MHLKPLKIFLILGLILVPLIGNAQKLVSKPFVGAKDHQSVICKSLVFVQKS